MKPPRRTFWIWWNQIKIQYIFRFIDFPVTPDLWPTDSRMLTCYFYPGKKIIFMLWKIPLFYPSNMSDSPRRAALPSPRDDSGVCEDVGHLIRPPISRWSVCVCAESRKCCNVNTGWTAAAVSPRRRGPVWRLHFDPGPAEYKCVVCVCASERESDMVCCVCICVHM